MILSYLHFYVSNKIRNINRFIKMIIIWCVYNMDIKCICDGYKVSVIVMGISSGLVSVKIILNIPKWKKLYD